jgi:hypothetical protein
MASLIMAVLVLAVLAKTQGKFERVDKFQQMTNLDKYKV